MASASASSASTSVKNVDKAVKDLVQENSKDEFLRACDILLKFASNVLQNPTEPKYRKIRLANKHVSEKLLTVSGGFECLFAMGFEESEDGEFLVIPMSNDLKNLEKVKADLFVERAKMTEGASAATSSTSVKPTPVKVAKAKVPASHYKASEEEFFNEIKASMSRVMVYENTTAQAKARAKIPLEQLQTEAKEKLASLQGQSSENAPSLDFRDCLLMALLGWFKRDFFSWVNCLPCERCPGEVRNAGSLTPSADDLRWGAGRVEAHKCTVCGSVRRFPRYTNAVKLLETRRGRCGEWADCFTLCCRAMGFEARYVLDWTDHVWTEVFSVSQQRWLHADSCENICDKPLLYESGWGKKLSYVLAFSKDEVQDVSWRYSAKHEEMLSRRTLCRESWLRNTVHRLCKAKMSILPDDRKAELWRRLVCELTEFLCVKDPSGEVLPGRLSGSVAWRQARGELGDGNSSNNSGANFIFKPSSLEKESKMIHFCYVCADDQYVRKSDNLSAQRGWQSCVIKSSNMMRKEENDWKMVYLARQEGNRPGELVWKFDVSDENVKLTKLEIQASSAVFNTGKVSWRVCAGDDICSMHKGTDFLQPFSLDLQGQKTLTITAVLTGGSGDCAWQHGQLFRQSSEAKGETMMEVRVYFK